MAEQVNVNPAAQEEEGMSLMDHLRELRERLFKAVMAIVIGSAIGLVFSNQILHLLILPYGNKIVTIAPTETLTNTFVVSLTFGAALAMPAVIYQILAFVMPGLLPNEKRWVLIGVPTATLLFVIGALFAWFIMLPPAIGFLTTINTDVFEVQLRADDYIPFVTGILFWIGVAFEMPVVIFVLARFNVVTARTLARQWRYAVVFIAILAALITPTPDPVNMSLVMAPLFVLYSISILMAAIARRGATTPAILDPDEPTKDTK
ncbi:MAG: twin-arginine translocase subunit TatC [Candidatus Roseilinea sp.]|uniref:twin-arginine translocase subunit TatC n=1 Tax=Candidatus Roseilinea sp. TaxID=2838777 RepID=UPI0040497C67